MPNRRTASSALVVGALVWAGGCVSDGEPDAVDAVESVATVAISVTVPPERQTPFCEAMIDLSDRLAGDSDLDDEAVIIEAYRSILPAVPEEISDDFRAVLTGLETGVPPPTVAPVSQPELPPTTNADGAGAVPDDTTEYFFPATTPNQRVNDYVTFACRDSQNNPGPPPTAPLDGGNDATDEG